MTSRPPIGSLVTHRLCDCRTVYAVVEHYEIDLVKVRYHAGPADQYDRGRRAWVAAIENLRYWMPSHVQLPLGV